jgi:hypothetical protein
MTLTFIGYASFITRAPFNGTFSVASGLAIGTILAAFITGTLIRLAPSAEEALSVQTGVPAFAPGTETVTETTMVDGTRKTVKTRVNPDGSKTITETVEQPV